jgi:CDP-paratose 2-epimerase
MRYLITGGCGFIGSNLAVEVLNKHEELFVFDNLYREGSRRNLEWIKKHGSFTFMHSDIRNANDVERAVIEAKPDVVFHLAGQVAMTTSIVNPRLDFEVNALGTFNVLEALRKHAPACAVIYSSTNKVYGDLEQFSYTEKEKRYICNEFSNGYSEQLSLDFHSPYGCSKGSADQYMLDYHRMFGIKSIVFRHSSMYGSRQFSTYDQGWIGWFCHQAIEAELKRSQGPFTISGDGKQVRDVLHMEDMKDLYFRAAAQADKAQGQAFNIGGGIDNSLSLLELFDILEELTGTKLNYTKLPWRESDQKVFIANITKAYTILGWKPKVSCREGVSKMVAWLKQESKQ